MRFETETRPEDRGIRLDVFLSGFLEDWTRSQLQALNRRGGIRVDGRAEKAGYRIRGGERIEVETPEAGPPAFEPEAIPLHVHYEDAALAIVEKPAGLVVHPGAGHRSGTLAHALLARFPALSSTGGPGRPGIVHRLDQWTSGLIVVAKSDAAHQRLSRSFERRQVRKVYRALVHGRVVQDADVIDLDIARHPVARTRMTARRGGGRAARSDYRVLERSGGFSLLEVRIHTGRTHQIRVHLSAIGHPVVGDAVYGEKRHQEFLRRHGPLARYFLHAAVLEFPHPETGDVLRFESPLPEELVSLWERLQKPANRPLSG